MADTIPSSDELAEIAQASDGAPLVVTVGIQGFPGPDAAAGLAQAGIIPEPTVQAMDAHYRQVAEVAVGVFADEVQADAQQAAEKAAAADASAAAAAADRAGTAEDRAAAAAARDQTEAYRDEAELYAGVVQAGAQIYPDTVAGLAATAEGDYFLVAGGGDIYVLLYRHLAGAAALQTAYASKQALDAAVAATSGVVGDVARVNRRDGYRKGLRPGRAWAVSDPNGRGPGFDFAGVAEVGGLRVFPKPDYRTARRFLAYVAELASGLAPWAIDRDGRTAMWRWLAPDADRGGYRTARQFLFSLFDLAGRTALGVRRDGGLWCRDLAMPPIDGGYRTAAPVRFSLLTDRAGRALLAVNHQGEVIARLAPPVIAQIAAEIGEVSATEYRPPAEFLGTHPAFNVRLGPDYRYATVQEPDGYVGDLAQRIDIASTTCLPDMTAPLELIQIVGQSNAGAGSGPTGPTPIAGELSPRYLQRPNANSYAYGNEARTPGQATDLGPAREPVITNQALSPAGTIGLAAVKIDRVAGRRLSGTLITTAWEGSQPLGNFFPGVADHYNFDNAHTQALDAGEMAGLYGRSLRHDVVLIQGEAGPYSGYGALLESWLDTVVPQLAAASGAPGAHAYLVQINQEISQAGATGVEREQLAVARARLGAGMTLAGPLYHCPLHDNIHCNNIGRMLMGETVALARAQVLAGVAFHPLWPVAGGITRDGAEIRVPLALPPGALALAFDDDWVAPVPDRGLVYVDDSGAPPAIVSVAIEGSALVVMLAATPVGANRLLRYGLDRTAQVAGWSSGRGQIYASTAVPSVYAAMGQPLPATIRHYLIRFEESVP